MIECCKLELRSIVTMSKQSRRCSRWMMKWRKLWKRFMRTFQKLKGFWREMKVGIRKVIQPTKELKEIPAQPKTLVHGAEMS